MDRATETHVHEATAVGTTSRSYRVGRYPLYRGVKMREYMRTVRQLRAVTGWGWVRSAVFMCQYGSRFARVSISASEGVRERNE